MTNAQDTSDKHDSFDLARFVSAQEGVFARALAELRSGRKRSHWMWYIFPQIAGLGSSSTARFYAIAGLAEAKAYLEHAVLGPRLAQCSEALLGLHGLSASEIFGYPDDLKLRSSMTLFSLASQPDSVFARVLSKYFDGQPDPHTIALVNQTHNPPGTDEDR